MTSPQRHDAPAGRSWLARLLAPRGAALDEAPSSAEVDPLAEPFAAGTGSSGVLLCHGFTGSPRSMRPWAEELAAAGFRVRVPRLPGHGTSWQELNLTDWTDWYSEVDRAFAELSAGCDQVFVCGLSMGGALALRLAEVHGSAVAGLALVNPAVTSADRRLLALPVLRYLVASIAGIANDIAKPGVTEGGYDRTPLRALASMTRLWRTVGARLGQVDQPMLLITSSVDHVVDPSSAQLIMDRVASADLTRVVLDNSFHVATLDHDAELIFERSAGFFTRLAASRPDQPAEQRSGVPAASGKRG